MSAARPAAKQQPPAAASAAAAASARKDSVDSVGSDVDDLQLESGNESADAAAGTPVAGGAAKKKRNKKKKKKAAAAAAAAKQDSDVDEPASDVDEPLSEEDIAAMPAPPAQPPAPASDDDMMLTASGKQLPMHREVWGRWSMSDYAAIKVRGIDYMEDGLKISPPCPPTMEIVHLEIYMCDTQVFHVCSKKDNWLQQYKRAQAAKNGKAGAGAGAASSSSSSKSKPKKSPNAAAASASSAASSSAAAAPADPYATAPPLPDLSSGEGLRPFDPDFFFVVNFHVQTAPSYHLTMYFQRREVALANRAKQNGAASAQAAKASEEYHEPVAAAEAKQAFDTLFARFISGDTAFRNSRLKLIPFVVDGGNWFVTKAVGNRPCIIGNKITTTYHCDKALNYMEVDIDVSGSSIGSGIFRVVKGYAAYLTLDLTLLIEGQEDDELPEVILGGCRLRRVDLSLPEMRPTPTE